MHTWSSKHAFGTHLINSALTHSEMPKHLISISIVAQGAVVSKVSTATVTTWLRREHRKLQLRNESIKNSDDEMEVTAVDIPNRKYNVLSPLAFTRTGRLKKVTDEFITFILNRHVRILIFLPLNLHRYSYITLGRWQSRKAKTSSSPRALCDAYYKMLCPSRSIIFTDSTSRVSFRYSTAYQLLS